MALTPLQRDQIIAAGIKDAKAGKPSLLDEARAAREAKAKQLADRPDGTPSSDSEHSPK